MACVRTGVCISVPAHRYQARLGHTQPSATFHIAKLPPCAAKTPDDDLPGESSTGGVESMFAKELARRQQMGKDSAAEGSENKSAEAPAAATAPPPMANEPSETPQLDRSRQLNSEGLEGLIPRAKILIQLGGTFFLGFLPFIAIVAGLFGALYFGFGDQFVHGGEASSSVPSYVDPYNLLLENYNDPYPTGQ